MSATMSIGVHDKSYYTSLAATMSECLESIVAKRCVANTSVPKGVLCDAKKFFASVREAFEKEIPGNPPAAIHDYCNASKVLREAGIVSAQATRNETNQRLAEFASLVESLDRPHKLLESEVVIAKNLSHFFDVLSTRGEEEMYEKVMSGGGDE